jgi:hypothetical protein
MHATVHKTLAKIVRCETILLLMNKKKEYEKE